LTIAKALVEIKISTDIVILENNLTLFDVSGRALVYFIRVFIGGITTQSPFTKPVNRKWKN
jgi:hypothetical protein